ncbi:MAG: hypothetical protein BWZ10_02904 [candidate division BRC1 bacterium ADurb.BinA364]|nr:MAG: hypothetical protein BWZ10_02904 [candidate division BRC1 bacterium ADurb.BinA364]
MPASSNQVRASRPPWLGGAGVAREADVGFESSMAPGKDPPDEVGSMASYSLRPMPKRRLT